MHRPDCCLNPPLLWHYFFIPCSDQGAGSRIWTHPAVAPFIEETNKKGIVPLAANIGLKVSLLCSPSFEILEDSSTLGTVPPLPVDIGIASEAQGTTAPEMQRSTVLETAPKMLGNTVPESVPETQGTNVPEGIPETQHTTVPDVQVQSADTASVDTVAEVLELVELIVHCSTPEFPSGLLSATTNNELSCSG